MAYSAKLEGKIDAVTARWQGLQKKKMFGGVGYLLKGNLCVGIWKDFLIVRMDKDEAARCLKLKNVRPFDITGTAMAGWIMVGDAGWKSTASLGKWLLIAKKFAGSLPEKKKKTKKKMLREYQR